MRLKHKGKTPRTRPRNPLGRKSRLPKSRRPRLTEVAAGRIIAAIVDRYGGDLDYSDGLPQRADDRTARVMEMIPKCRSGALGGCSWKCGQCDASQLVLKSCGDRHCPTCGGRRRHRWHEQVTEWALGCDYLHTVLTVPHELNDLIAANPGILLRLLASCSRQANLEIAAHRYGVLPGLVQVLHTWGQFLLFHYHVHTILTAGGLAIGKDGKVIRGAPRWVDINPDDAQSRKAEWASTFKTMFVKGLKRLHKSGKLRLPVSLADDEAVAGLLETVEGKDWIADVQGTPPEHRGQRESQHVFGYVAKYVGGVAIGNSRILRISDAEIVFDAKDYRDNRHVEVGLPPREFCWRLGLHVLPRGMPRLRYAGLFATVNRQDLLPRCRQLLGEMRAGDEGEMTGEPDAAPEPTETGDQESENDYRCHQCEGKVELNDTLDGSLTVSLLAVAKWMIEWQQQNRSGNLRTRAWINQLRSVIEAKVSAGSRNTLALALASGLRGLDEDLVNLIIQAIEHREREAENYFKAQPP